MSAENEAGALEALVKMIARAVVAELRAADSHADMIDQTRSPLTAKKHCAIVRARIARGAGGAAIAGRKHLITRGALQEELDALTTRGARKHRATKTPAVSADNDLDVYLARYGVERKAG